MKTVPGPAFIAIWVSDDGKNFTYTSEVIAASWDKTETKRGYLSIGAPTTMVHYITHDLKAAGRFVKFTVWPGGMYTFCDELEVFGSDVDPRHCATLLHRH